MLFNGREMLIEPLERRFLMSFSLKNGVLRVTGTPGDDRLAVYIDYSDASPEGSVIADDLRRDLPIADGKRPAAKSAPFRIILRGAGGNDTLGVILMNWKASIEAYGGSGRDKIAIEAPSAFIRGGDGPDTI